MKFLCDACKTKYQIDDDKVAGKTARMKCRKCGHIIEIRAAGSPSVAPAAAQAPARKDSSSSLPATGAPRKPVAPPARPSSPSRPALPARPPSRPAVAKPLHPVTQPIRPTAVRAAPRPGVAPLQTRGALASDHEVTSIVASPLQAALEVGSAALDSLSATPPPAQWFVAIDGAPIGPISEDDIAQHIKHGKVKLDSLAWRDGIGDWRRAADIAEIAHLFNPAKPRNGQPVSGVQARTPLPGALPTAPANGALEDLTAGVRDALAAGPIAAASESSPFASSALGGNPFEPAADPFGAAPADPFGAAPALAPVDPFGAAPVPAPVDPFGAAPVPVPVPADLAMPAAPSVAPAAQEREKKGVPWIPIAMVAGAVAFAITAAIVVFYQPQPTTPAQVEEPAQPIASAAPSAVAPPDDIPAPEPSADLELEDEPGKPAIRVAGKSGTASVAPAASTTSGAANLKGLLGGTSSGPSSNRGAGGGGGSGSLTQGQIESTVRNYSPGVKKNCWDNAATKANSGSVTASITIGASGSVQNVSSSGPDPALNRCVEARVRSWKFPPPGGSQTVNVPFKFLRQ